VSSSLLGLLSGLLWQLQRDGISNWTPTYGHSRFATPLTKHILPKWHKCWLRYSRRVFLTMTSQIPRKQLARYFPKAPHFHILAILRLRRLLPQTPRTSSKFAPIFFRMIRSIPPGGSAPSFKTVLFVRGLKITKIAIRTSILDCSVVPC